MTNLSPATVGKSIGVLGAVAGVVGASYILFGPAVTVYSPLPNGQEVIRTISGIEYLFGVEGAEAALFY